MLYKRVDNADETAILNRSQTSFNDSCEIGDNQRFGNKS